MRRLLWAICWLEVRKHLNLPAMRHMFIPHFIAFERQSSQTRLKRKRLVFQSAVVPMVRA
jgi:hypothetical protein